MARRSPRSPTPAPAARSTPAPPAAVRGQARRHEDQERQADARLPDLLPDQAGRSDSTLTDDSRAFPIDGPGNEVYRGYKFVAELPDRRLHGLLRRLGHGLDGSADPRQPDETKTIGGRDYLLSWDGHQLRLIGWKTDHGSYWVDNTLLNVLTPGQMFGIAESMRHYKG